MNRLNWILASLFLCLSFAGHGQKTLELTDTQTGKTRAFKIGKMINYKIAGADEFEKAKIQNLTADNIVVLYLPNEDEGNEIVEIPLNQIHSIRKITCFHKTTQAVGAFLMAGGAYMMLGSASLSDNSGNSQGTYVGVGAGMFVLGILPYLVKPKTYVLGETHTAAIK